MWDKVSQTLMYDGSVCSFVGIFIKHKPEKDGDVAIEMLTTNALEAPRVLEYAMQLIDIEQDDNS